VKKVLIIDDDAALSQRLSAYLISRGFETATAAIGSEGLKKVEEEHPHLVLLDRKLPDMDGLTLLQQIRRHCLKIPVIMMTAYQDMESTIKAMRLGAHDYLCKPVNLEEFDLTVHKAITHQTLIMKAEYLFKEVSQGYKLDSIVGKSKNMQEIYKVIGQIADTKATVLIQGESGTGKELLARAVHYSGINREKPFIAINCSAIVDTLLESELFGHEKGAFTGAISRTAGKLEAAQGGMIFLDEISEMSLNLQAKMLRVLQEKEFDRVGGNEKIQVDVRFAAATNRKLEELIKRGKFREDLYYRLKVVTISLPPLRERQEDIPCLIQHFLQKYNRETNKNVKGITQEAMSILVNYFWPGNVRELENTIERAVIFCRGELISKEELPGELLGTRGVLHHAGGNLNQALEEFEKEFILKTLVEVGWNKSKASQKMGIHRTTLLSKLKKYRFNSAVG
jgi:two-component system response regulator AtoC